MQTDYLASPDSHLELLVKAYRTCYTQRDVQALRTGEEWESSHSLALWYSCGIAQKFVGGKVSENTVLFERFAW